MCIYITHNTKLQSIWFIYICWECDGNSTPARRVFSMIFVMFASDFFFFMYTSTLTATIWNVTDECVYLNWLRPNVFCYFCDVPLLLQYYFSSICLLVLIHSCIFPCDLPPHFRIEVPRSFFPIWIPFYKHVYEERLFGKVVVASMNQLSFPSWDF